MRRFIKSLMNASIRIEGVLLLMIGFGYWYATPFRDQWVWLITLLVPVYLIRWRRQKSVWPNNPLILWIITLIVLCLINIFTAPYETRGLIMVFRPLYGFALVIFCLNLASSSDTVLRLLQITTLGAFIVGAIALTASDWSEGKIEFLRPMTQFFLQVTTYPGVEGLFNVNELGGAMTWVIPLTVGLTYYFRSLGNMRWHWLSYTSVILMVIALLIGQSLSASIGVLIGVLVVIIPNRYWLSVLSIMLAGFLIVQIAISFFPQQSFQIASSLSGRRNVESLEHRAVMWQTAQDALLDYPFTGLGMAMYRSPSVWEDYPTPGFDRYQAFHAHNELLGIGTDLGIPGMVVWIALYFSAGQMLFAGWQRGGVTHRLLVKAIAGGLLAHAIYGLTDAIPIWDRFAFFFWWMLGLAGAQYVLVRQPRMDSLSSLFEGDFELAQEEDIRYSPIDAQA
jgi:O-antigen ligase